ncbi:barstar family protein [Streptomyces sp. NPDC057889]|uniref:barstar family protein n=1 Tax=unclassified Streptomyces TaxID=2593676 RepID=UPI0036A702F7
MITIDVSGLLDERALHQLLPQELGFPDFYGKNWDAFWGRDHRPGLDPRPSALSGVGTARGGRPPRSRHASTGARQLPSDVSPGACR